MPEWYEVLVKSIPVFVVFGIMLMVMRRRRRARKATEALRDVTPQRPSVHNDPWRIWLGDRIAYGDHGDDTFLVTEMFIMRDGVFPRVEHFIDSDDGVERWLSITARRDSTFEVILWTALNSTLLAGKPGEDAVTYGGLTYAHSEERIARYSMVNPTTATMWTDACMRHVRYAGPSGGLLVFRRRNNGDWKAGYGQVLDTNGFTVYPPAPR